MFCFVSFGMFEAAVRHLSRYIEWAVSSGSAERLALKIEV